MKKNILMFAVLALFGGGIWSYYKFIYEEYPQKLRQLDRTIQLLDEKLISAQIIHQQLDLVANLIEKNLALSKSDSLAEDASLPFLEYVTGILSELEVKLLKLEPGKKSARLDYVRTPYTLTLESSYENLGKFVNRLEKSERLITVEQFEVDNAVRKSSELSMKSAPDVHEMVLKISTLTLIKQR
jgi:Tfp pilus assembly protein PilO